MVSWMRLNGGTAKSMVPDNSSSGGGRMENVAKEEHMSVGHLALRPEISETYGPWMLAPKRGGRRGGIQRGKCYGEK